MTANKFRTLSLTIISIVLLQVIGSSIALRICHQCSLSKCFQATHNETQTCADELDSCVTVFRGESVRAQGCLLELKPEYLAKCETMDPYNLYECHKCETNLCNNLGPTDCKCIQCDSELDPKCRSDPKVFNATRCPISRSMNCFCFVQDDGEHTVRACASDVKQEKDCLNRADCQLCSPLKTRRCNEVQIGKNGEASGSGSGSGSGNGSGSGSGSGSESGSGSGSGSVSGSESGSGSGSGNGSSGSGSGSSSGSGSGSDKGPGNGSVSLMKLNLATLTVSIIIFLMFKA